MREAARALMARNRLGRDVFGRGMPEKVRLMRERQHTAGLFDLLKAYTDQRIRRLPRRHVVRRRTVWSIKDARTRLALLMGEQPLQWVQLDRFLAKYLETPAERRTILASSLGAALEMAREGLVDLRQDQPFGPVHVKARSNGQPGQRGGKASVAIVQDSGNAGGER